MRTNGSAVGGGHWRRSEALGGQRNLTRVVTVAAPSCCTWPLHLAAKSVPTHAGRRAPDLGATEPERRGGFTSLKKRAGVKWLMCPFFWRFRAGFGHAGGGPGTSLGVVELRAPCAVSCPWQ